MTKTIEVDDKNFEEEVLKAKGVVVVDFWAPWCGPCKMQSPILEELAEEFAGKVKITEVNVDKNSKIAGQYNIMSIPTILIFKEGKICDQAIGMQDKPTLIKKLEGFTK